MAVTFRHGKGANLKIANASGSLVNLSSGIDEMSIDRALDTAEVSSFGDNDKSFIAGLRGATISFSGMFASTHAEILDGIFGHTTNPGFEFSPDGSTASGRHLLTGTGLLTSLNYGAKVDDRVTVSAEFLVSGAVTSTKH